MIPKDKILAVVGMPRSGTSLCMQTLQGLGVPIGGLKWASDKCVTAWNPKGTWEVPVKVFDGITEVEDLGGKAVKLVNQGLIRTKKDLIWKGVLCLRNPKEVLESNNKIGKNPFSSSTYIARMLMILEFLKTEEPENWLVIDYKDAISKPKVYVQNLASFLGIPEVPVSVVENIESHMCHCSEAEFDSRDAMGQMALELYEQMHDPWESKVEVA